MRESDFSEFDTTYALENLNRVKALPENTPNRDNIIRHWHLEYMYERRANRDNRALHRKIQSKLKGQ